MKKGEKRKLELLQIAYRLFVTKGYEKTSVDEIIEAAVLCTGRLLCIHELLSR